MPIPVDVSVVNCPDDVIFVTVMFIQMGSTYIYSSNSYFLQHGCTYIYIYIYIVFDTVV